MLLLHLEYQLQFFPLLVTSINTQKYKDYKKKKINKNQNSYRTDSNENVNKTLQVGKDKENTRKGMRATEEVRMK